MIERNGYRSKYSETEARSLYINAMHTQDTLREALTFAKRAKVNQKTLDSIRAAVRAAAGAVRYARQRADWAKAVTAGGWR